MVRQGSESPFVLNARNFRFSIDKDDENTVEWCKKKGLDYDIRAKPPRVRNAHERSHLARTSETVNALAELYKRGSRKILSVYGSSRDKIIADKLNNTKVREIDDPLEVILYRPVIVPKDASRVEGLEVMPDLLEFDGFLFGDVYMTEDCGEISPAWLAQFVRSDAPAIWLGHQFLGAAGTIEGEGAWVRRGDFIVSKPDASDATEVYTPHPDANWLCNSGQGAGLYWTRLSATSQHLSVLIREGTVPFGTPTAPVVTGVTWVDLPLPEDSKGSLFGELKLWLSMRNVFGAPLSSYRLSQWLGFFPKRRVYVHQLVYMTARRYIQGKARTPFTFASLDQTIRAQLEKYHEVRLLQQIFPEDYALIQFNTLLAAFLADTQVERESFVSLRAVQGTNLQVQNEARKRLDQAPAKLPWETPRSVKLLAYGGLALVAILILKRYGIAPAHGDLWNAIQGVLLKLRSGSAPAFLQKLHTHAGCGCKGMQCVWRWMKWHVAVFKRMAQTVMNRSPTISGARTLLASWLARAAAVVRPGEFLREFQISAFTRPRGVTNVELTAQISQELASGLPVHEVVPVGPTLWSWLPEGWRTIWWPGSQGDQCSLFNWLVDRGVSLLEASHACPSLAQVVLAAPVYEELVKETWGWTQWGIPLLECALGFYGGGIMGLLPHLPAALMHLATTYFKGTLWKRVGIHFAWNAMFYLMHRRASHTFPVEPGCLLSALAAFWASFGNSSSDQSSASRALPTRWSQFRATYYDSPWSERVLHPSDAVGSSSFNLEESIVARTTVGHFVKKPRCPDLALAMQGAYYLTRDGTPRPITARPGHVPEATQNQFMFLPTNVPFWAPTRSDALLWDAVIGRIMVKPPLDPSDQARAWTTVDPVMKVQETWIEVDAGIIRQWLDHIDDPVKKARLTRALDQLQEGFPSVSHNDFKRTPIFVKTDEVLFKWDPVTGQLYMKVRAIANLSSLAQAATGPTVYEASRRIKRRWPLPTSEVGWVITPTTVEHIFPTETWSQGTPNLLRTSNTEQPYIYEGGLKIWVTYGAALTDRELSEWMNAVVSRVVPDVDVYILVAGDDSLVGVWENGVLRWYEADAGMFDQSESYGPLLSEYRALHKLGVPGRTTDLLFHLAHASYRVAGREHQWHATIDRSHRPMRDTGGADTSIGNSIVMAQAWVHVARAGFHLKVFSDLGLDMKVKQHQDPTDPTFLKGKWYLAETLEGLRYVWGPLPSRFLKMGKSLRDPRALYRAQARKDLFKAYMLYANDVAHSYAPFLQVPIVRAFVQRYLTGPKILDFLAKEHWKVQPEVDDLHEGDPGAGWTAASLPGDRVDWTCLLRRYDISMADIEEVEDLIRESKPGEFLEHPVFLKLAAVDYA
jgi:hypothetical protein